MFSMAKFMSSWILFDVAVLEDLWLALSLLVSLWKLNLPACRKFDYAAGKILLLLLPIILGISTRVGPQVEKSSNLHITPDSTGSIHKNARGKKFDPKKVRLGWGNLI